MCHELLLILAQVAESCGEDMRLSMFVLRATTFDVDDMDVL